MNQALLFYAALTLWGVGLIGMGSIFGRPVIFYGGILIFIINLTQLAYWASFALRHF